MSSVGAAAARLGIPVSEYEARRVAGEKWCTGCKAWHPRSAFNRDGSRGDGLDACCLDHKNTRRVRKPPPLDQRRAHRRIWMRVNVYKLLAHPNTLPCMDCGHVWEEGERRHEYDHPRGYEGDAALDVEPVCTLCHTARERTRRHG